jgi:hypothetical protein
MAAGSMIEVVQHAWLDRSSHDDLPAYLAEPPSGSRRSLREWRDDVSRALQRPTAASHPASAPTVPFGGVTPRLPTTFSRMVALRRDLLPGALDDWWAAEQKDGSVRVHRRLQLKRPEGDAGTGWRMQGRIRRLTTLRWIPVVVELWPMYDEFTMMTMTPQRPVLATKFYFRCGHAVLDHLWADLASRAPPAGAAGPSRSAQSPRRP